MSDTEGTAKVVDSNSNEEKSDRRVKIEKHKAIVRKKKQSFEAEYIKLSNRFERALIEHKLADEYYGFRSFYFNFLPLTIIASLITIIGFLLSGGSATISSAAADGNDGSQDLVQIDPLFLGESKNFWSIIVGVLGAISTLLTTIGKYLNYQSQQDMHRSAVKALDKICLIVDFERDWFDRKANSDDFMNKAVRKRLENIQAKAEQDDIDTMLGADLKSHQASFQAMQDSCCDSSVPTRVSQAFTVLDQLSWVKGQDRIFYYHKLWKEFSLYPGWPVVAPKLDIIRKCTSWRNELMNRDNLPSTPAPPGTTALNSSAASGYGATVEQNDSTDKCCQIL